MINNGNIQCEFFMSGTPAGTAVIAADGWHHIVCEYTVSGANVTQNLYIDGALRAISTNAQTDPGIDTLSIGVRTGTTDYYNGSIDEVRIYNRALSAAEVNKLYQMGR